MTPHSVFGFAYEWSFDIAWRNLPLLLEGARTTFALALLSMLGAVAVGAVLAIFAEFGATPLRILAIAYTETFRSLPLLVLVYWVFLALPILTGWQLDPFQSGLLALMVNVSAFVGEAFRAGMGAVGPGQRQAALALGMSTLQLIRRVVWPQTWLKTLPIVGSIWVGLFKDSALVSLIQVHDLMFQGRVVANRSFRYLEVYAIVALIYYLIAYPQARVLDWLFDRFRTQE